MRMFINNKSLKIALVSLILFRILVYILNENFDLYILILGVNQCTINLILDILIIITVCIFIFNCHPPKILRYLINSLAILSIALLLFINLIENSSKRYFYFKSPNNSNTLVIEEDSFLLGGWSKFYEKKGLIFIKNLNQQINTDDGYTPFSYDDYELRWLDNDSVKIIYGFGSMNIKKKEVIKFNS